MQDLKEIAKVAYASRQHAYHCEFTAGNQVLLAAVTQSTGSGGSTGDSVSKSKPDPAPFDGIDAVERVVSDKVVPLTSVDREPDSENARPQLTVNTGGKTGSRVESL